ncbi:hypothetical protein G6O69_15720 [Pseudenhygromyxa sp. WMMC2535]|uniref:hypothetical protein n=1 Tax=Pseudenhygromyxa sp. WMMC2535 TaxID=2712867 RepID=UPI001595FF41|nr:hypothetical protein [Pseudenhygromyxa sp. WMMC2535]NVB39292.1 hypothetical protein [Pseudenhygromyxa sp. WMMC2535]
MAMLCAPARVLALALLPLTFACLPDTKGTGQEIGESQDGSDEVDTAVSESSESDSSSGSSESSESSGSSSESSGGEGESSSSSGVDEADAESSSSGADDDPDDPDDAVDDDDDGPSESSSSSSGSGGSSSESGAESSSESGAESSSEEEEEEEEEEGGSSSTTGDLLSNGEACTNASGDQCLSGECYTISILSAQCGECDADEDCPNGGCTPHNPNASIGSTCNMGELGGGCSSDGVCQDGLVCAQVAKLIGVIELRTCSLCDQDADCGAGELCVPLFDFGEFSGVEDCIDAGSLAQDSYCDLEGNGDQVCASGSCAPVDYMGLLELGTCGECKTDADCPPDQGCVPGEFDYDLVEAIGSTCQ